MLKKNFKNVYKKVKNDIIIQQGLLLLLSNINTFFNFDLFFISVNFEIKKYNTFELDLYVNTN